MLGAADAGRDQTLQGINIKDECEGDLWYFCCLTDFSLKHYQVLGCIVYSYFLVELIIKTIAQGLSLLQNAWNNLDIAINVSALVCHIPHASMSSFADLLKDRWNRELRNHIALFCNFLFFCLVIELIYFSLNNGHQNQYHQAIFPFFTLHWLLCCSIPFKMCSSPS